MRSIQKKALSILLCIALLLSFTWGYPSGMLRVGAAALDTNLLANPGGEVGGGANLADHSWIGSNNWYSYNNVGGITPHGGSYFMAVYNSLSGFNLTRSCYQDINISDQSSSIDNNTIVVTLSGWLRSSGGNVVKLQLQELDQYGNPVTDVFEKISSTNAWGQVIITEAVVPSARILRVTMEGDITTAGATALDDLSLKISQNTDVPPTVSQIPDQATVSGDLLGPLTFTATDIDTALSNLQLAVSSSNQDLLPNGNITASLSSGNGAINLTSVSGKTGQTVVTVAVSDGIKTTRKNFTVTVNPALQLGTNLVINGNGDSLTGWTDLESRFYISSSAFTINLPAGMSKYYMTQTFNIGKFSTLVDAGFLTCTTTSTLSGGGECIVQGMDASGTVLWSKTSNPYTIAAGTRSIQVKVGGSSGARIDNISLVITGVDVPKMTTISNQTIPESSSTGDLPFMIGYTGSSVALTATSSNPSLIPVENITFGGNGYERTIRVASKSGASGVSTITVYANGIALKSFQVKVTTAPSAPQNVSAVGHNGYATITFDPPASDGGSTITHYTVASSVGGFTATGNTSPIRINVNNGAEYSFTVTATNNMGSSSASAASNVVTSGINSNVTLTASPISGAKYGDSITLTATVQMVSGVHMPTGTVAFKDGSNILVNNVPLDGTGKASYIWNNATAGNRTLTAEYSGDDDYVANTENISYTIEKADQAALLFSNVPSEVTYGGASFDLTITGGSGTGNVTFAVISGDAISINGDTATIRHTGAVTIKATKLDDENYNEQTATITITVKKAATTLVTSPSAEDIVLGNRLKTTTLSGGTASVAGTFQWAFPDTLVMEAGTFGVTFIPSDTTNYLPFTFSVPVGVQPIKFNATISIGTNNFASFLNTVTFGVFFKSTKDVTITGDVGVGGKIEYQKVTSVSGYDPNGTWIPYTNPFSVNPNDQFIIYARLTDSVGNETIITSQGVIMDHDFPVLTVTPNTNDWSSSDVVVTIHASDAFSGLKEVTYRTNEARSQSGTAVLVDGVGTISMQNEGQYTLTVSAIDNAGNQQNVDQTIKIDKTAPHLSLGGNPTSPAQFAKFDLYALAGPSGKTVTVTKIGGTPVLITGTSNYMTHTIMENGYYIFRVENGLGAYAQLAELVTQIDRNKPVVSINSHGYTSDTWTNKDVTLDISNSTNSLGTTKLEYSLNNGEWIVFDGKITVSENSVKAYQFRATSESGIVSDVVGFTVKVDSTAPTNATIKVKDDSFASFLNTITFGLFFKETLDVSITANCDISGQNKIEYQKVSSMANYSESGIWTNYSDKFSVAPDQQFIVYARITDNAGNYVIINTNGIITDSTAPDFSLSASSGWQSTNVEIAVTVSDNLAGLKTVSYTTDEAANKQSGTIEITSGKGSITLTNNGHYTLIVTAMDKSGNAITKTADMKIDKTLPTINVTGNPSVPVQSASLAIATTAGVSGVSSVTVKKDSETMQTVTGSAYTVTENGSYVFTVTNGAGVTAQQTVTVTQIDRAKPIVSINSHDYVSDTWINSGVTLDVSNTTSNLGVTTLEYSLNSGNWTSFNGKITVSADSVNAYQFRAISASGVVSDIVGFIVKVDTSAPVDTAIRFSQNPVKTVANFLTFGLFFDNTVEVQLNALDEASGIKHCEYQMVAEGGSFDVNDTWTTGTSFSIAPDFKGSVYARTVDKANNVSGYVVKSLVTEKTKPGINATYAFDNVVTYNAAALISVSVTDNGAGVGNISYQIDGAAAQVMDLTTAAYTDLTKEVAFNIDNLPFGSYDVVITATDNSGNAADSVSVHVKKSSVSKVTFNPITASVKQGEAQQFSATVEGENDPSQSVTWMVTGNESSDTSISPDGKLNVSSNETAKFITIKATSAVDGARTITATVSIIPIIITHSDTSAIYDLSNLTLPSGVTQVSIGNTTMPSTGSNSTTYTVIQGLVSGDTTGGKLDRLAVYDLKLLDQNGNAITEFTGKVKVKLPIPSGMSGNLHVLWYNDSTGKLTDMQAIAENGYLVFETTHFSFYAIAQLAKSNPSDSHTPDTGDTSPISLLLLIAAGSTCSAVVFRKRRKVH